MDVESAHLSGARSAFDKTMALLAGAAAVLASILGTIESDASKKEERSLSVAARISTEVGAKTNARGQLFSFEAGMLRASLDESTIAQARFSEGFKRVDLLAFEHARSGGRCTHRGEVGCGWSRHVGAANR